MKAYYNCKTPTSLTIPGSVTSIGALAFYNCNKVDTIVIEEGVTTLPESVFDSVKPIRVYIPLSVTTIERAAFSGGSTITDVYYPGTQAQYYAISIADQSNTQVNPRKYSNTVYHYGYSKNHTPVAHPATEPTCTNAGNTAYWSCADCDMCFSDALCLIEIAQNSWIVPALGHDLVQHPYQAPTCTEDGHYAYQTCTRCDYTTCKVIPAHGHEYENGVCKNCGLPVSAESGWCGVPEVNGGKDVSWTYYGGKLTISGSGEMRSFDEEHAADVPWYARRGELTDVTVENGVVNVGGGAFRSCKKLSKVQLAASVTSIGYAAFENCAALASIGLPKGLSNLSGRAFYGCAGLNWITIPEKVKTIGVSAFRNCVGLKSVGLPAGLENIFDSAFEGCSALASVELPGSVQSIEDFAFRGCAGLVEVKLPENSKLWLIEEGAFSGCTALRRVEVAGCTRSRLPDSVQVIHGGVFSGCTSLEGLEIYDNVFSLFGDTFSGCTGLEYVRFPSKESTVPMNSCSGCVKLKEVILPEGISAIGEGAFRGCASLEDLSFLPDEVDSIGKDAFSGCTGLRSLALPDGLKIVYEGAFDGCAALRRADLPASLEYVYQNAFNGCAALRAVYYGGTRTDWAEVWVYEGNEPLQAAARYYADDAVTIETPDFTGGKVTVTVRCDAGVKARAVCAIFDADGKLLSVEVVELKQGQDNVLVFDGCDPSLTVTLLAIDADSAAPLCAAMKT